MDRKNGWNKEKQVFANLKPYTFLSTYIQACKIRFKSTLVCIFIRLIAYDWWLWMIFSFWYFVQKQVDERLTCLSTFSNKCHKWWFIRWLEKNGILCLHCYLWALLVRSTYTQFKFFQSEFTLRSMHNWTQCKCG